MKKTLISVFLCAVALAGCATSPSAISTERVSKLQPATATKQKCKLLKKDQFEAFTDNESGLRSLQTYAGSGNPCAEQLLGSYYHLNNDGGKAFYWTQKAALQGNSKAEELLGKIYTGGYGVKPSAIKSVYWQRKAALQGNANAESDLGNDYSIGYGVRKNDIKAAYWWKKAALQGNQPYAEEELGNAYFYGHGIRKNIIKADHWYRKFAVHGIASDGIMEKLGYKFPKNQVAKHFALNAIKGNIAELQDLHHAAVEGTTLAETWLGVYYETKRNYIKAVYWYKRNAKHVGESFSVCKGFGSRIAANNLGYNYYNGLGVEQSYTKAIFWWKKAALGGNPMAEDNLAVSYYYGKGVKEGRAMAEYLWNKASSKGGKASVIARHDMNQVISYGHVSDKVFSIY